MAILFAIIFSFFVGAASPAPSMDHVPTKSAPEIVLHLKQPLLSGNSVKLGYEIPYPGYIEFHLFQEDGERIWQNFGVREKGEHYQAVRLDKLTSGAVYHYEFWYKGKPYKGKFTA
jgi:hypothetical protein